MHRFGHIGRSEINHDALRRFCFHDTESFIAKDAGGFFGNGPGLQRKIDETRACDHGRLAKIANLQLTDDSLREFPRIFATLFSEHQSSVCLVIAEAPVGRWRQFTCVLQPGGNHGVGKPL
jgi:hypothetical protein